MRTTWDKAKYWSNALPALSLATLVALGAINEAPETGANDNVSSQLLAEPARTAIQLPRRKPEIATQKIAVPQTVFYKPAPEIKSSFNKERQGRSPVYVIDSNYGLVFRNKKALEKFHTEFVNFMNNGALAEVWRPASMQEKNNQEQHLDRIDRVSETAKALFVFSHVSRLPTEYWLGAGKRESYLDWNAKNNSTQAHGALQIREMFLRDAIRLVQDPLNLFEKHMNIVKDPNVPMEEKLETTKDTLWAAHLKEATVLHYLNAYPELPNDLRSIYLVHLGVGHARSIATALKKTPGVTVNKILPASVVNHKDNNALFKHKDGKFKTVQQFYGDLKKLGIPSGPITDTAVWNPEDVRIIRLSNDDLENIQVIRNNKVAALSPEH